MKKKIDNIIFFSESVNIRAGGPAGYIANLECAIHESNIPNNIVFINANSLMQKIKKATIISNVLCFFIPIKHIRHNTRFKLTKYLTNRVFEKAFDKYIFRTITVHSIYDVLFVKKYLKSRNLNAKILQMSHSPQLPSQEKYERESAAGIKNAKEEYIKTQQIEKNAFESANMYIFPSQESIDCYSGVLTYLDKLLKTRPIQYVRTGCRALQTNKTRDEMRKFYNIKTPFVITYIGRHNKIKGYDKLKQIASKILDKRDDITFIIGGNSGEIKPLKHQRWIELGQINPAEVLMASDIFILPNRQTYFDLILLEVLSTGTPVVASNTGGNKTVFKDTGVITLYDDVDDCIEKTLKILDLPKSKITTMRARNKKAYYDHYSLEHFAKNYINMIEKVCNE